MLAHDLYCCPTSNIKNVFKSLYLAQHCSISEEGERARESVSLHLRRFHLWRSGGGGGSNQEDGKLFCLLLPLLFLGKGAGRERNGLGGGEGEAIPTAAASPTPASSSPSPRLERDRRKRKMVEGRESTTQFSPPFPLPPPHPFALFPLLHALGAWSCNVPFLFENLFLQQKNISRL